MNDFSDRFSFIYEDSMLYSNDDIKEAYINYFISKNTKKSKDKDPFNSLISIIGNSINVTMLYMMLKEEVDKQVKAAVIKSGGTWTAD